MMGERYHATTQNRFYPGTSNVNKNITVEAKLINPPTYISKQLLLSKHRVAIEDYHEDVSSKFLRNVERSFKTWVNNHQWTQPHSRKL